LLNGEPANLQTKCEASEGLQNYRLDETAFGRNGLRYPWQICAA